MSLSVSIGVMAHNEGKNIGRLLDTLFHQILTNVTISEVIIVSSGSTDKTNQIVREYQHKNNRIKLIDQKMRKGKANAVNLFLSKAKEKIVVLLGADLLLERDTLNNLIQPFRNRKVGIVGSHPIPVNSPDTFMGFAARLLWDLHHRISLASPKMGEMIAFRKIFKQIPMLSAVDEANIEPLIRGQGYKAVYAPGAIVYNKGPDTLHEFIARRRHCYAGHLATKYEYSYEVSTLNGYKIFLYIIKNINLSWRFFLFTPLVIILEVYSRLLGFIDYKMKLKSHTIWEVTPSTKTIVVEKIP